MGVADRSSLPRRPLPRAVEGLPALGVDFTDVVSDGLREIGLDLDEPQLAAITAHVRLLLAWNEHVNLSGLRTQGDIARGHVLDALIAVPALRGIARGRAVALLDMGSGGGFPGLPLAIALPARRAALVDSIAKKAAFLEAAAGVVGDILRAAPGRQPEIVALPERAEDLADEPDQRDGWDLVVARAVGSVAECAELGLPLARRAGHVAIWKRASDAAARRLLDDEIGAARRIIQAAGGGQPRIVDLDAAQRVGLPGACLVVVRKVRSTPDRYPRSPGERRRTTLP